MSRANENKTTQIYDLNRLIARIHPSSRDREEVKDVEVLVLLGRLLSAPAGQSLLPPEATRLRTRLEKVVEMLKFGGLVSGDYFVLLTEIIDFNVPGTFTPLSSDSILREVADQILAKANQGDPEVLLGTGELAAWGNTINRALAARPAFR